MSMQLNCEYQEKFDSKLGKKLMFVDRLRLYHTPGQSLAYILKFFTPDEKSYRETFGREKTNSEVYNDYLEWIKQTDKTCNEKIYKYTYEDTIAIAIGNKIEEECEPTGWTTSFLDHFQDCEAFFTKYGGVENVHFYVS